MTDPTRFSSLAGGDPLVDDADLGVPAPPISVSDRLRRARAAQQDPIGLDFPEEDTLVADAPIAAPDLPVTAPAVASPSTASGTDPAATGASGPTPAVAHAPGATSSSRSVDGTGSPLFAEMRTYAADLGRRRGLREVVAHHPRVVRSLSATGLAVLAVLAGVQAANHYTRAAATPVEPPSVTTAPPVVTARPAHAATAFDLLRAIAAAPKVAEQSPSARTREGARLARRVLLGALAETVTAPEARLGVAAAAAQFAAETDDAVAADLAIQMIGTLERRDAAVRQDRRAMLVAASAYQTKAKLARDGEFRARVRARAAQLRAAADHAGRAVDDGGWTAGVGRQVTAALLATSVRRGAIGRLTDDAVDEGYRAAVHLATTTFEEQGLGRSSTAPGWVRWTATATPDATTRGRR